MATSNPTRIEEPDALASLEERILRAVQLVNQLRSEKEQAEAQARALRSDGQSAASQVEALKTENARLLDEVAELREERIQVRSRIEKLLGQMDTLAG
jgi:FtsZ-binding cell division protein ZapB